MTANSKVASSKKKDFLAIMSARDTFLEHDTGKCGQCAFNKISAEAARDLKKKRLKKADQIKAHLDETQRRWRRGKFYKFWKAEAKAGRSPERSFEKRGWIP